MQQNTYLCTTVLFSMNVEYAKVEFMLAFKKCESQKVNEAIHSTALT